MSILVNLAHIREEIERVCFENDRDPQDILLIAVTKAVGIEEALEVVDNGVLDLGENRAQEAADKAAKIDGRVRWHFIGHLQSNKVKTVVRFAEWIHSVDSLRLAGVIDDEARKLGKKQKVLIQVNIAGESSKSGFSADAFDVVLDQLQSMYGIEVRGLMTMAPIGTAETARAVFKGLRELAERERKISRPGIALEHLSMGMTQDYQDAIAEGATMVRIGSAIFGSRPEGAK